MLSLKPIYSGKVRELYDIDDKRMLMVATDRLSAFDVILPQTIPNKGVILTQMSNFWFGKLRHIITTHLLDENPADFVNKEEQELIADRAVVVKKLRPLPIEAVVRGFIAGSGWNEYKAQQSVCGIKLPNNLQHAEKLENPIFTPSTKAAKFTHDENISFQNCIDLIGEDLATQVSNIAIALYQEAFAYAEQCGIIIADTKFEFGLDENNNLVLMDEVLTPDSSRFWAIEDYEIGTNPASFDKQFIRDYLIKINWDKNPPIPDIPPEIIQITANKYQEALTRLTTN